MEPWVVQVLKIGYQIHFVSCPHLSPVPLPFPSYSPNFVWGLALCCADRLVLEECHRTGVLGARILQSFVCDAGGHWRLAARLRSLSPQPFHSTVSLSHGNPPVGSPISPPRGLDGVFNLQDAYPQVPVHPELRRYLRFCVGRQTFQF